MAKLSNGYQGLPSGRWQEQHVPNIWHTWAKNAVKEDKCKKSAQTNAMLRAIVIAMVRAIVIAMQAKAGKRWWSLW